MAPQSRLSFKPQGDTGLLAYLGASVDPHLNARLHALANSLEQNLLPGVREIVPAYACLLVVFDPLVCDHGQVQDWISRAEAGLSGDTSRPSRVVELPVVYGGEYGPDLEFVAGHTGLSQEEVIARHGAPDYLCYLVGFTPGFPFLGGLDPALETPRLETPRLDLPPGSVGIAANQAGIYPLGGPGGWQVLGRSPLLLYDPRRQDPFMIKAGDRVRFVQTQQADFPDPPPLGVGEWAQGEPVLEVLRPGAFTTVQDQGRWGFGRSGVPVSGAMDQFSLAMANALVGNSLQAAALEITVLGPKLKVLRPVQAAVCGADLGFRLDGAPAPLWRAISLQAGQVLDFTGPRNGSRATLATSGGMGAPLVMASRSTYSLGRLGAPLKPGQLLTLAESPGAGGFALADELIPTISRRLDIRVLSGPNQEHFSSKGLETFYSSEYAITSDSDRRGIRLKGPGVELNPELPASILSEPGLPGIIQVPAGGDPIILLREQTVGGYAKIATVISADLDLLARALPGDVIRFQEVSLEQALAAARQAGADLQRALTSLA